MTVIRTLLCSFVFLVIAHQITAQPSWQFPTFGSFGSGFGGSNGSSQSGFLAFPFQIPSIPEIPSIPGIGGLLSTTSAPEASSSEAASSRRRRDAQEQDEEEPHNRRFPSITTCNYTEQANSTCTSCRQALICLPNNVGIRINCRGRFRYCDNGRCSRIQGSACTNSTE